MAMSLVIHSCCLQMYCSQASRRIVDEAPFRPHQRSYVDNIKSWQCLILPGILTNGFELFYSEWSSIHYWNTNWMATGNDGKFGNNSALLIDATFGTIQTQVKLWTLLLSLFNHVLHEIWMSQPIYSCHLGYMGVLHYIRRATYLSMYFSYCNIVLFIYMLVSPCL